MAALGFIIAARRLAHPAIAIQTAPDRRDARVLQGARDEHLSDGVDERCKPFIGPSRGRLRVLLCVGGLHTRGCSGSVAPSRGQLSVRRW